MLTLCASFFGTNQMIKSKFISDILDLLLDGDDLGQKARSQINFLTDKEYKYTGVGLFVGFGHLEGIEKFRLRTDKTRINGLEIKSSEFDTGAEAMVEITNGLIDCLEIWSYGGEYPTKELTSYTLTQGWTG